MVKVKHYMVVFGLPLTVSFSIALLSYLLGFFGLKGAAFIALFGFFSSSIIAFRNYEDATEHVENMKSKREKRRITNLDWLKLN